MPHLDKWLAFAVENKVREIHLLIGSYTSDIYCLPKTLDNATYLTVLELQSVVLDPSYSLSFPFLKTLSLVFVQHSETAKDDVLCKILLGCPSLEKLRVHYYDFLCNGDKLRLRSSSLKFLELIYADCIDELQIEAINLESLVLNGDSVSVYNIIDISACKKIRNLSLDDTSSDEFKPSLQALISNNPLLENLTLIDCISYMNHLRISTQHLKSFNFKNSYSTKSNITIESTPELAHFCYKGHIDLSISIEPSNRLSGKIVIYGKESRGFMYADYDAVWFTDMLNFLLNLNCSWNIVSLHVERYEALIWPEKLKRVCRSPLLNWKHLRVITKYRTAERRAHEIMSDLKDSLMWISPSLETKRVSDLKDSLMWISPSLETLSINNKQIF
ncbi:uncharacterized protein LOC133790201 [Humulus lupulus]|uniref:uncharacterized protein LOC133790201 n=1 Tax=Humulus lupulus TaxID=3486 RepID=UPI002B412676|nr:uncharacterized protein LOC133790201 [Humulus lupulus]